MLTLPITSPMFDTINFSAPFGADGGISPNTYLVGRVDCNPTDKTQMFFRKASIQLPGSNNSRAFPQYCTGITYLNQSYLYSLCHTFTPSLFLSVPASYTRSNQDNSCDLPLKCCR